MKIDKIYHFAASYALILTANLVFPLLQAAAIAFAVGIIKELFDYFDYGRFDFHDLLADSAGVTAGAVLIFLGGLLAGAA